MTNRPVRLAAFAVFAAAAFAGCPAGEGGTPDPEAGVKDALTEVGSMVCLYSGKSNRGPAKVADLSPYQDGCPAGFAAVKSGEVVVRWGKTMAGECESGTADVIAYEKKAPAEGGYVLLHNGAEKKMGASDLASLGVAPAAK